MTLHIWSHHLHQAPNKKTDMVEEPWKYENFDICNQIVLTDSHTEKVWLRVNPFSANPTKWPNILTNLADNYLFNVHIKNVLLIFPANISLQYPLKTSKNHWFSDIFRKYIGNIGLNWVNLTAFSVYKEGARTTPVLNIINNARPGLNRYKMAQVWGGARHVGRRVLQKYVLAKVCLWLWPVLIVFWQRSDDWLLCLICQNHGKVRQVIFFVLIILCLYISPLTYITTKSAHFCQASTQMHYRNWMQSVVLPAILCFYDPLSL